MKKVKVAILAGGFSSEREISLKTGSAVYETLKTSKKYDVSFVDIKKNLWLNQLLKLKNDNVDIVFISLHGKFGEDGKLQSILDLLKLKYTGANALSSAIAMNKILTKKFLTFAKIPTPKYFVINKNYKKLPDYKFPLIIKPPKEGSAIGVSIATNEKQLITGLKLAFEYDDNVIVEEYIQGKELSVPILGKKVLPIIEIRPQYNKFYDYKSKYTTGGSIHIIPAQINKKLSTKISNLALKSMKSIGCEVMCRVDIILDNKNNPYVLEINTIPGMTKTSLFPESAKSVGIDFYQLLDKIIDLSFKKYC